MKAILLTLFWLLIFFWLIRSLGLFRNSGLKLFHRNIFFGIKLLCGLALYLIYTHYYPYRNTSDAFKYFDDSQVIYNTLPEEPESYLKLITGFDSDDPALEKYYGQMETWYRDKTYNSINDNRTIIRINALFSLVSGGVYFVHIVFFCFLAFTGLLMLFMFISGFSPGHKSWIALLLFFSPSILFWSSGVLKEAIVLFSMGGFLFIISKMREHIKWTYFLVLILFTGLLLVLKVYIVLTLLPALLFWFITVKSRKNGMKYSFATMALAMVGVLFYLSTERGNSILKTFTGKQKDFINISKGGAYLINCTSQDTIYIQPDSEMNLATTDSVHYRLLPKSKYHHWTYWKILDTVTVHMPDTTCYSIYGVFGKTGSSFEMTELKPEISSFIKMLPEAWANVLFRPYPAEITSGLVAVAFLENLTYLLLILYFILNFKKPDYKVFCFITGSILFVLLLAAVIGFVTPVTGAIVRYRIPLLPFLLCSFLMISDAEKLKRHLPHRLFFRR